MPDIETSVVLYADMQATPKGTALDFTCLGPDDIPYRIVVDMDETDRRFSYIEFWPDSDDTYLRYKVEGQLLSGDFAMWMADSARAIEMLEAAETAEEAQEAYRGLCIAMTTAACLEYSGQSYTEFRDDVVDAAYSGCI